MLNDLHSQRPQLEGKHIHRSMFTLWKDTADSPRIACCCEDGQFLLALHAGSLHGITPGSIFHIYKTDQIFDLAPCMTAVTTEGGTVESHLSPQSAHDHFSSDKQRGW